MELNKTIINRLKNKDGRAVILGLGISNVPLCRVLLKLIPAEKIIIRDQKKKEELKNVPEGLENAVFITGGDPCMGLCDAEDMSMTVIFRSPGVRPVSDEFDLAKKRGALIVSEMEWFCDASPADIYAVTGSDGKTTTTTLTYLFLKESGFGTFVGGNIGKPLLEDVDQMKNGDCAVLELSSFQLFTMNGPAKRAAITNIAPNHLNWHKDMQEYTESKYHVFGDKTELLVVNAKNEASKAAAKLYHGHVIFFTARNENGESFEELTGGRPDSELIYLKGDDIVLSDGKDEKILLSRKGIKLPGIHNVENYMTAIALTMGRADMEAVRRVAEEFGGVEHRFELVRELNGVKYYNSSIDSSPSRTVAALSNLNCRPVVICGGRDKHVPFDPLADALFEKASAVVLTGEAANQIKAVIEKKAAERADGGARLHVVMEADFAAAVKRASELAVSGSAVILSPACTSFDRFANFEERGRYFKELVNKL